MIDVFRKGGFEADDWTVLADGDPLPAEGKVFVTVARLTAEHDAVLARNAPIGLVIEPSDRIADLKIDLGRFAEIAVRFPKFADGRGFSIARLLRERHGYRGEIRAIGDVLIDLIPFMGRVGFTAFTVTHEPTRAALTAGRLPLVPYFYQPAADDAAAPAIAGRPWLRTAG
jgi:uncharacterized protein (DUF934 family)